MDLAMLLPLIIAFGALIYFNSRRQKKAMQATINLHDSLQIGDRVHTTSGMQATIVGITDDNVDLEIAPGVVTTWMKLAVRDRIVPETTDGADDAVTDDTSESHATELTESTGVAPTSSDPDRLKD
jgi:preprotein translocase subunit YajC